jgi:hypothetical protein
MIKIFIGYDKRETIAYHTLVQSIIENSSQPISITPLKLSHLSFIYNREDLKGTTEFSLTRFLVPYLSSYEGYSIFMDCDMICNIDIGEVINMVQKEPVCSVYVCKHQYESKFSNKATGKNENYPRKNWSSFMVFNNSLCLNLTPEYVNSATPSDLHRLIWAYENIGNLPLDYNWLVGEYENIHNPKILHYTLGTPCFNEYRNSDYSKQWYDMLIKTIHPLKNENLNNTH